MKGVEWRGPDGPFSIPHPASVRVGQWSFPEVRTNPGSTWSSGRVKRGVAGANLRDGKRGSSFAGGNYPTKEEERTWQLVP